MKGKVYKVITTGIPVFGGDEVDDKVAEVMMEYPNWELISVSCGRDSVLEDFLVTIALERKI